ncbi:hypothetical protein SAMN04487857_102178 [Pseudomonas sp. ok272]|uniref:PAAR domain-containing protein n=1 Tax=unclassified Pseudomonas TaxID=196821 RepID=UPI0008C54DD8|nr:MULTISPECIES: PAAR domain-containing protein [unclassified Pseudomonas]SEM47533.1 hypothetical protein SAMN04487857_102178 [Pseudomonas sp. ok272]SFM19143.1 hypothetical protein SAMN04487858_101179 [Pseudomonas sp. ok602]
MATGYFIRQGDKTTCGGTVLEADSLVMMFGFAHSRDGDRVSCGKDGKTYQIRGGVSFISSSGRRVAGTLDSVSSCPCRARFMASFTGSTYEGPDPAAQASSAAAAPRAAVATPAPAPAPVAPRPVNVAPAPSPSRASAYPVSGVSCENIWYTYQQRAEAIVAPDGVLIADPKARNRAINAAYATLWLRDPRLQWAGLAAFASKQVGCGLLHAADSIEKVQAQTDAAERMVESAKRRMSFFGLTLFGGHDERAQREYEQALRDNPLSSIDLRLAGEEQSLVQQNLQHVHDLLAMGNTTLFLDVYPLHAFYLDRGLEKLEKCLPARQGIYGDGWPAVLWPVGQQTLEFGNDHEEILLAFRAIEAGNIAESVKWLATHEQANILQPAMYSNPKLVALLYGNHLAHVTNLLPGATQAIELTLASQCRRVDDGRTIGFSGSPFADLSNLDQRMAFVLRAAAQFDELLRDAHQHSLIEQAIRDIAFGRGVR